MHTTRTKKHNREIYAHINNVCIEIISFSSLENDKSSKIICF